MRKWPQVGFEPGPTAGLSPYGRPHTSRASGAPSNNTLTVPCDHLSFETVSANQQIILVIKTCLHRKRSDVSVEEQLSCCALCQDVLKDPVSTSCGHWFCNSASPHTGTSLLQQETPPVPSVEKDPEQELDCRQPVRPALYKVRLYICLLTSHV